MDNDLWDLGFKICKVIAVVVVVAAAGVGVLVGLWL